MTYYFIKTESSDGLGCYECQIEREISDRKIQEWAASEYIDTIELAKLWKYETKDEDFLLNDIRDVYNFCDEAEEYGIYTLLGVFAAEEQPLFRVYEEGIVILAAQWNFDAVNESHLHPTTDWLPLPSNHLIPLNEASKLFTEEKL